MSSKKLLPKRKPSNLNGEIGGVARDLANWIKDFIITEFQNSNEVSCSRQISAGPLRDFWVLSFLCFGWTGDRIETYCTFSAHNYLRAYTRIFAGLGKQTASRIDVHI